MTKNNFQSFLGMVNFYRRFIRDCAAISRPLTELTGNSEFSWDESTQNSFKRLKDALCSAQVLRTYGSSFPIQVTTDASGNAIGVVLEQEEDGQRRPVALFLRTMKPHVHERNVTIIARNKSFSPLLRCLTPSGGLYVRRNSMPRR
jgi:hypothetical protein